MVRLTSYYLPRISRIRSPLPELATLATALVLGFLHALEIDHMLAVTTFVSRRPALATAAGFGLRWGMGHSLAVLALGGVLLATGLSWPERWTSVGEGAVGVMLVALGLWSLRATRNLHVHPAPRAWGPHPPAYAPTADGRTDRRTVGPTDRPTDRPTHDACRSPPPCPPAWPRGITLVGLAHGLAGTSSVVALVPVTLVGGAATGVGVSGRLRSGVTVAMTLFALGAAVAVRQASLRSLGLGKRISSGVGLAGVAVGVWWIVGARGVEAKRAEGRAAPGLSRLATATSSRLLLPAPPASSSGPPSSPTVWPFSPSASQSASPSGPPSWPSPS